MNRSKHHERIETLHHNLRTSMRETVHCRKHNTETVEKRNADAKLVICCELHMLTCKVTVVGDVIVSEHDTLREACRT